MNYAALVSGGVDSTVAVHLLKEQGIDPYIFYIKIGLQDDPEYVDCPSEEDIEITTYVAKKYGLPFEVISLQDEYWKFVVSYTIDSVRKGLTPNPDMMCNKLIKFGVFNEFYGKDFAKIATGHYASTIEKDDFDTHVHLGTAKDKIKDQTYFLAQISQQQLNKLKFPLGNYLKSEVREIAKTAKLPSAYRKDSQGICFLGKINYNSFIRRYVGVKEGDILEFETGKMLGKHQGFWFHTIGQRKGLGLGGGPWFVVKKDAESNIIYVSNGYDPENQYSEKIILSDFHFLNEEPDRDYSSLLPIKFKIRHQPEFSEGKMVVEGNNHVIYPDQRISGVAPGQYGVIYNPEATICLGSGVISL